MRAWVWPDVEACSAKCDRVTKCDSVTKCDPCGASGEVRVTEYERRRPWPPTVVEGAAADRAVSYWGTVLQVCSVEELVLQHYAAAEHGGWRGVSGL
eukprot:1190873-Prorocentrum_minimum.AAC.3